MKISFKFWVNVFEGARFFVNLPQSTKFKWFFPIVIFSLLLMNSCAKQAAVESKPIAVAAEKVIKQDVDEYIETVGTLVAYASVDITSQAEGTLTHILFNEGEFVQYGKLLFTLDPRIYEATLESAQAALQQDIAKLNYAKQYAQAYTTLAKENYVSRLSAAESVQNVEVYEANIEADKASIRNAEINLEYTRIRAPLSGYISLYSLDVGNYVPKDNTKPLATIRQITPINVNFSVPSTYFENVRCGQQKKNLRIQAFLQNRDEAPLEGELTFINNTVNVNTGMILLQGEFPNKDERGWPGDFVRIRLFFEQLKNALVIPVEALQRNEKGPFVFIVKDDMTVEIRQITAGFRFNDSIVATEGLQEGEMVVTDGQLNLSSGVKVQIEEPLIIENATES